MTSSSRRTYSRTLIFAILALLSVAVAPARAAGLAPLVAPTVSPVVVDTSDPDRDGLITSDELTLKTDPNNVDSDCDYVDDKTEVVSVAGPANADGDKIINALESKLVDSDGDKLPDQSDPSSGPQVSCGRFMPFAIQNDNVDSTRLELRLAGGTSIISVTAQLHSYTNFLPNLDGTLLWFGEPFQLFDDGSHGDRLAGDGIWTRNGFTSDTTLDPGERLILNIDRVTVYSSTGAKAIDRSRVYLQSPFYISLTVVNQSDVVAPTTARTDVQTASNVVNFIDPLLSLKLFSSADLVSPVKHFYKHFQDEYDFLFFYPEARIPNGVAGRYFPIYNDVVNIGPGVFDSRAFYGNAYSMLQGAMFVNFETNGPILHELMHRWGVGSKLQALGFSQCTDSSHWGVAGVGKGQLGGFDPATLVEGPVGTYSVGSFGPFANGGDSVPFAPIEKYLAGFASSDTVGAMTIPLSVNCASMQYSNGKHSFKASGLKTVTINQVMNQLGGPRYPTVASSQKSFHAGMSVISQYPLSGPELTMYNEWSKETSAKFSWATDNVGSIDTTLGTLIKNDPPVAYDFNVDVDATLVARALDASDPEYVAVSYTILTKPSKGQIYMFNPATGEFKYAPNPGASGVDTFTFKAFDGLQHSNVATATLNILDTPFTRKLLQLEVEAQALFGATIGTVDAPFTGVALRSNGDAIGTASYNFSRLDLRLNVVGASSSATTPASVSFYSQYVKLGTLTFSGTTPTTQSLIVTPGEMDLIDFRFVMENDAAGSDALIDSLNVENQGTRFQLPYAQYRSSGGDRNGYETSPTAALKSDNIFARDTNSGTSTATTCGAPSKDSHIFRDFVLGMPLGAEVKGLQVQLDAKVDSKVGLPRMCVMLSGDGGLTWTAAKKTVTLTPLKKRYTLGSPTDLWGRSWSAANLVPGKLLVRVVNVAADLQRDFFLDSVAVKVSY